MFIRSNRAEIIGGRTRTITFAYEDITGEDPFTGEPIGGPVELVVTDAVVTEIDGVASRDRLIEGAIIYEVGDVKVSVPIDILSPIADKVKTFVHDDVRYEIISMDKKGLGYRNRYEVYGRKVT